MKANALILYYDLLKATRNVTVDDETFNALKAHCDDNEIIEITYVAAFENYLNRMVKPLGMVLTSYAKSD